MSSLAELPALVGFFSYSREDDEGSGGRLSKLRERIQEELRLQLGRTKRDFRLWQDKEAIAHGELWEETIKKGISESVFFIPIITPTAVRSSHCKLEFDSFLAREKGLDRSNLIFPILYVPVPTLRDGRWRQEPLLSTVGSRQYEDWQNLRHLDASSSEVALRVEKFCANICRALEQPWLSPEERQQAEARRLAEAERRRQEAEIKQRAADEERRRKAEAEAEKQRGQDEDQQKWDPDFVFRRPEQAPQQPADAIKRAATWKRFAAPILDLFTVFISGGSLIALITGETAADGSFNLHGASAVALMALIGLYFFVGRRYVGGTLWDRIFRIERPTRPWRPQSTHAGEG
jgi:TIR domain